MGAGSRPAKAVGGRRDCSRSIPVRGNQSLLVRENNRKLYLGRERTDASVGLGDTRFL